jgi:hypothetical protein
MIPISDALDLFNCSSVGQYLVVAFIGAWALKLIYHK